MSFRPNAETLRWAAGQVLASGPATPDTTPLHCAQRYIREAAKRLRDHADYLDSTTPPEGTLALELLGILDAMETEAHSLEGGGSRYLHSLIERATEIVARM